jgi:hypothetical protein
MRWRVGWGALTVAVGLALATANGLATPAATKVVYVAPVDPSGKALPSDIVLISTKGSCEPGSDSVPGPVYRCFNDDNTVLDPCWAVTSGLLGPSPHHRSVLCMPWPWSWIVVRLDSTTALPASTQPVPPGTSFPWGVHLANGENCLAAQGAHDQYRGRVVDYYCGSTFRLVLLRGMHQTTEPWTFDSAIWSGKSYSPGPTETVRIAYYGRYAGPR